MLFLLLFYICSIIFLFRVFLKYNLKKKIYFSNKPFDLICCAMMIIYSLFGAFAFFEECVILLCTFLLLLHFLCFLLEKMGIYLRSMLVSNFFPPVDFCCLLANPQNPNF